MIDPPCGFPIVTQKRSSSSLKMPRHVDDTDRQHQDANNSHDTAMKCETFTVPIRAHRIANEAESQSHQGSPLCLTAMETDCENTFTAIVTIRYYDEVKREYRKLCSDDTTSSTGDDVNANNVPGKIQVTTTITTMANVSINISLASEPFQSSSNSDTQQHRITLSATTDTKEYDDVEEDNGVFKCERDASHVYTWSDVEPQVVFSSNGKHLACVIPRPIRKRNNIQTDEGESIAMVSIKPAGLSTVVIFNLEPQTIERNNDKGETSSELGMDALPLPLPLPKYLQADESFTQEQKLSNGKKATVLLPPISTNPLILTLNVMTMDATNDLTMNAAKLLSQITCLCDINHNHSVHKSNGKFKNASLLLAGCTDGSILMIGYKRAILLGMLYHNRVASGNQPVSWDNRLGWDDHVEGLRVLKYHADNRHVEDDIRGKFLAVRRDGHVALYSTSFHENFGVSSTGSVEEQGVSSEISQCLAWESKKYSFKMNVEPKRSSLITSLRFANGTFIDADTVALLVQPLHSQGQDGDIKFDDAIAQVWSIGKVGSTSTLIAKLCMDHGKLDEVHHGVFNEQHVPNTLSSSPGLPMSTSIEYDESTGCLAIASAVPLSRSTKTGNIEAKAFVSLWDWTASTIGFTLACTQNLRFSVQRSLCQSGDSIFTPDGILVSRQQICKKSGTITIVHTFGDAHRYQRDEYYAGILSPSRCRRTCRGLLDQNPIFLSKDCIMYPDLLEVRLSGRSFVLDTIDACVYLTFFCPPFSSQPSVNKEMQVEWRRSILPPSYTMKYGPITIASIGDRFGRSLAVIGSKGLCVLDIHREDISIHNKTNNGLCEQYATSCLEGFQCQVDNFQLKNKQDRWQMFQRIDEQSFTVVAMAWWEDFNGSNEDIIIAVVKYVDRLHPHNYLVAWSSRR